MRCLRAGGTVGIDAASVDRIERETEPTRERRRVKPQDNPLPSPSRVFPLSSGSQEEQLAVQYVDLGNQALGSRDYAMAETHYRSALDQVPGLPVARLNLAVLMVILNRHAPAEEILFQVLADDPDEARAHFLLGETAYRQGRWDEAIERWERAQTLEPLDGLATKLAKARRLADAEEGYSRSDAAHFILRFDGDEASPELAQEIITYLEQSWFELAGRLVHYPDHLIHVTLYSRQAFIEATESTSNIGGLFDGQMRIPIGGLSSLTSPARRVLIHELGHAFIASKCRGNAPRWIHEGFAQVLEGKTASGSRASLGRNVEILGGGVRAGGFSYPKALSQVEFLLDSWSESHLVDLLDHLGRGTDIDSALRTTMGLGYPEFLTGWGEWLRR